MRNSGSLFVGLLLICFGAIFLLDNLSYVDSEYIFENFWPLILVFVGLSMLLRRPRRFGKEEFGGSTTGEKRIFESSSDFISRSALFGEVDAKVYSKNFTGGNCSVVFGQIEIDLSEAQLAPGTSSLRLNSVFGSVRVTVPRGMEFSMNASLVAGELRINDNKRGGLFESSHYKSDGYDAADRKLMVLASQVFGDIRVIQKS